MTDYDAYNSVTIFQAIQMLNEALNLERTAISSMFNMIVPCKGAVINSRIECIKAGDTYCTTVLGLFNSIFGFTVNDSTYRIFPIYDNNQQILEFRLGKLNT